MVFIVKIPNRSRANTPEASNTPSNEHAPAQPASVPDARAPVPSSTSTSASMPAASSAAELDVLLAPSVLNHRYVRGVDKSLIVERPERIRAVLLGIAAAIGKSSSDQRQHPPLPQSTTTYSFQPSPTSVSKSVLPHQDTMATSSSLASSHDSPAVGVYATPSSALPAAPAQSNDDDDDLIARLNSLSVQADLTPQPPVQIRQKFRVLHSTRSLSLDPPHPAVAFTHAHADEKVTLLESAYEVAKKRRREAQPNAATQQFSTSSGSSNQLPHVGDALRADREGTPTPASLMSASVPTQQFPEGPTISTASTSHAAYLEYLCSRAPNHAPFSHHKHHQSFPSNPLPEDSEAYTSSDGEGDDAMHLSEIPEHLPQGDLYLAGPSDSANMDGGSAEAIRHAMGACCEAVDRVTLAAASSDAPTSLPLREIQYDTFSQDSLQSDGNASPAKRAFVLSRPPGHHCSGSTPQGFCWVNNAIVAAAHGYLQHAIDRVVIFDIDLHHGNGTQNLAWRINADANKHDDLRSERIASLRAAALDKARQALGSGHGRAHASRVAKVALTEQDEAEVKRQAGPRALRLFYSSLHDIESFPCEDGDANMIKDASTCVEGAHGQWIWNIHLDHYRSESDFKRLYDEKYKILFAKAARFLTATSATPQSTLVLISAGFDACAYEYPGMQRHGKHVPPSFYHTFARDAVQFADSHAKGKLVSVLEGGYSDRALCSAALAHVTGLAFGAEGGEAEAEYWKLENLIAVEKVAKKMAAHAAAATVAEASASGANITPKRRQAELAPWLSQTSKAFAAFEQACGKQHVVALGASATPLRGAASAAAARSSSAISSPSTAAGGRVLRDRGALKSRPGAFDSAASTPQPRRAASPIKATPTRASAAASAIGLGKKESPNKKASPSKGKGNSDGGPFEVALSMPVKHGEDEDGMAMDTDPPTRGVALGGGAGAGVMRISSTVHAEKAQDGGDSTRDDAKLDLQLPWSQEQPTKQQQTQHPSQVEIKRQANLRFDGNSTQPGSALPPSTTFASIDNTTSSHPSITAPPTPSPAPAQQLPLPTTTTTLPSSTASFLDPTSSTAASPKLTCQPVTLVDAMSAPHEQIVDANVSNILRGGGHDLLGLDYLRSRAFQFANGEEEEEDAPGSPDLGLGEEGGYFPKIPKDAKGEQGEREVPGGLGAALAGLNLKEATLARGRSGSLFGGREQQQVKVEQQGEGASSLYPHLPSTFGSQTDVQQQQRQQQQQHQQ
ncbi:hypothetical protein EX895_002732 [Sporisorium graminicola]|uniref:Histone deacetylase domain-containing protein n=1 Tax=Sporisorium graminicola TaxID=280036 RepID=A0A4U7KV36_9BASI|nr:hypothetical protein EX895_002732 [Sporisorium graminicola]TKY88380.1 hypothetical protein EX895_002732 [Sporisorium graminicola]